MKKLLLVGIIAIVTQSQSFACELLVKDVKLTAQEKQSFTAKGFVINEVTDYSSTDVGKLTITERSQSEGVGIWDGTYFIKDLYKIAKLWDYSEDSLPGRPVLKYFNYVAKTKSMNAISSCASFEKKLDRMIERIIRTGLIPHHDENHGAIFLKD